MSRFICEECRHLVIIPRKNCKFCGYDQRKTEQEHYNEKGYY